jgi:protein MAK11
MTQCTHVYIYIHIFRVKAFDVLSVALPSTPESESTHTTIISTISSDGFIRIFDLSALPPSSSSSAVTMLTSIAEYDTKGSRLTCCTLADGEAPPSASTTRKRKHDDESDDEQDIDEGGDGEENEDEEEEFAGFEEEGEEESGVED